MVAKKSAVKASVKKPSLQHKEVKNKAVVQPVIEADEQQKLDSNQANGINKTQISDMLEDIHDIFENAGEISVDFMKTVTDSMTLTTNLMSNILSGASECVGDMIKRNASMSENFMKCSNMHDLLSFQHDMFDNNYGLFNRFGVNCGDHMNIFSKNISEVVAYNLSNNWAEKFKNKKKCR